jgi:hypothetical protein
VGEQVGCLDRPLLLIARGSALLIARGSAPRRSRVSHPSPGKGSCLVTSNKEKTNWLPSFITHIKSIKRLAK